MAQTLIAILNWNNAADTIACIKSVMALEGVHIAVVDNQSSDGSYAEIKSYIQFLGGYSEYSSPGLKEFDLQYKFSVIQSPVNTGFAGGNNIMLRAAMATPGIEYVWLLNNDAVAVPGSLETLVKKMNEDSRVAFVGSVILDGTNRELVQCCGVEYHKWFGVSKLILKNAVWSEGTKRAIPYGRIDFQNGASLLVRVSALKEIGLMDEHFFLYSEEHDWQESAKEKGYKNILAADSVVYHKGSVSTNNRKHLFFYYYNKSGVIFARKHDTRLVRTVSTFLRIGILLVRSRLYPRSLYWGLKGIFEGWTKPL